MDHGQQEEVLLAQLKEQDIFTQRTLKLNVLLEDQMDITAVVNQGWR